MKKTIEGLKGFNTKIEQIQGNVLTNSTKHKNTIVHERFQQKLSSPGARRLTTKTDE